MIGRPAAQSIYSRHHLLLLVLFKHNYIYCQNIFTQIWTSGFLGKVVLGTSAVEHAANWRLKTLTLQHELASAASATEGWGNIGRWLCCETYLKVLRHKKKKKKLFQDRTSASLETQLKKAQTDKLRPLMRRHSAEKTEEEKTLERKRSKEIRSLKTHIVISEIKMNFIFCSVISHMIDHYYNLINLLHVSVKYCSKYVRPHRSYSRNLIVFTSLHAFYKQLPTLQVFQALKSFCPSARHSACMWHKDDLII